MATSGTTTRAQILNYITYTDSSNSNHTDDGPNNFDLGTRFTVGSTDISVVALGAWGGSGILNSTGTYAAVLTLPVATNAYLWSDSGTLLATVTLAAGTSATGASTVAGQGFAFASLPTPITLTAGSYYVTSDSQGGSTPLGYTRLGPSEYSVGSDLTTNGLAQFALSNGTFPNFFNAGNATFGGNFQYTLVTLPATTWTGIGDWSGNPANWSTGTSPVATQSAIIGSGTVTVSTSNAVAEDVANAATVNVASGGVLTTSTFENQTGSVLDIEAGGTVAVSGAFTQDGNSTLVLGNGVDFTPGSMLLSGATSLAATVTVNGADSATIGSVIADSPAEADKLVKNGAGTLVLNQANTYSGGTEIEAGTLQASNGSALGSGSVTVDGGATLDLTGGHSYANDVTISGSGAASLGAIHASDNTPAVEIITGTTNLASDATIGADDSNATLELANSVALGGSTLATTGSGQVLLAGAIAGTGGLTVGGTGSTTLGGTSANTYTGDTLVNSGATLMLQKSAGVVAITGNLDVAGTVNDMSSGQLGSSTVVTLAGAGNFNLEGPATSEQIAGLVGTSANAQFSGQGSTLTLSGSGAYDYAGKLVDGGTSSTDLAVAKSGTGSEEFDGANTYHGGTQLQAGRLIAGNSAAFGTGLLAVSGGVLLPGAATHQITVGSYAQTGGTLQLSVIGQGNAATPDRLVIDNSAPNGAALGGALTVNLSQFTVAPISHGTTKTFLFDLVDTQAGYQGVFDSFHALDLLPGLTASLDYALTPNAVDLVITQQGGAGFSTQGLSANQQAILASINDGLASGNARSSFSELVNALTPYGSNPPALGSALNQLSPQAFGQFATKTTFNNASFNTEAMDEYLAGQRVGPGGSFLAGSGAIDTSALTVNDPSYAPNLTAVHSRLLAWSPTPVGHNMISDSPDLLLGGIDLRDSKAVAPPAPAQPSWNFFVRGNVVLAQGFSNSDVSHFDANTTSVSLGADYRLTPHLLLGVTAGYGHTDATLDDNGSSTTVDSYSPGVYAAYADSGWHANFVGNYIHNAYTQDRVIAFLGQTAASAPEGDAGVADIDGGYDFHCGALTFGPLAGLQYTHLIIDSYHETGSVAALDVNEQQADSLRSRLGGRLSCALRQGALLFTPHLDASWQHEFMDPSRGITSQFGPAGLGSFNVRTINPSRDSALIDFGVDTQLAQTLMVFVDYSVQVGDSTYFGQSAQAGIKLEF